MNLDYNFDLPNGRGEREEELLKSFNNILQVCKEYFNEYILFGFVDFFESKAVKWGKTKKEIVFRMSFFP